MKNIKLVIAYDGARYSGWQSQGNTENTIQGKLSALIAEVTGEPAELIGASRTDAGVHAKGQTAHFKTASAIAPEELKKSLNEKLGRDVCVLSAAYAGERFHARYNAKSKKYLYRIWNRDEANVFERKYAFHVAEPLDTALMRKAAGALRGTHDFRGFTSDKRTKKSTVKTIYDIDIKNRDGMVEILVHGDSFLYNMVRIIAGTLVDAGHGKLTEADVAAALTRADRKLAGFTVPPHGLFLTEVIYDDVKL